MLAENVRLKDTDLQDGRVPADVDMLLLLGPDNLNEKQLFAVDQFLMQGGTVMMATSPFDVKITNTLQASKHKSGLEEWLTHHGLSIVESMVLDPKNASLPVPVRRNLGPISVNEIQMMPYPHFPDIRKAGLNDDTPVTSGLGQLTLNWASPLSVDLTKNSKREVIELLHSSSQSWTSDTLNIMPDYRKYPDFGFPAESERQPYLLGVSVKGTFISWFSGKESPLLEKKEEKEETSMQDAAETEEEKTVVSSIIEHSSDSARIILIASNTFASDGVINLASQGQNTLYTSPLEFVQNSIDWSLDDQGLMSIRSRAQFSRTLFPMEQNTRLFWEYLNYGLALMGLLLVWFLHKFLLKKKQIHYKNVLAEV